MSRGGEDRPLVVPSRTCGTDVDSRMGYACIDFSKGLSASRRNLRIEVPLWWHQPLNWWAKSQSAGLLIKA